MQLVPLWIGVKFHTAPTSISIKHVPTEAARTVKGLVYVADQVLQQHAFLGTPGGIYQRGDLIALGCDYEFEQLVKMGSLPFDCAWADFARRADFL